MTISPFISLTNREKHHTSERHTLQFFNLMFLSLLFLCRNETADSVWPTQQHQQEEEDYEHERNGTVDHRQLFESNSSRYSNERPKTSIMATVDVSFFAGHSSHEAMRVCVLCVSFIHFVTHFLKIEKETMKMFSRKNNNKITSLFFFFFFTSTIVQFSNPKKRKKEKDKR